MVCLSLAVIIVLADAQPISKTFEFCEARGYAAPTTDVAAQPSPCRVAAEWYITRLQRASQLPGHRDAFHYVAKCHNTI